MISFKTPEDHPAFPTIKELIEQLITAYSPPGRSVPRQPQLDRIA